jgi:hypothetical protein
VRTGLPLRVGAGAFEDANDGVDAKIEEPGELVEERSVAHRAGRGRGEQAASESRRRRLGPERLGERFGERHADRLGG